MKRGSSVRQMGFYSLEFPALLTSKATHSAILEKRRRVGSRLSHGTQRPTAQKRTALFPPVLFALRPVHPFARASTSQGDALLATAAQRFHSFQRYGYGIANKWTSLSPPSLERQLSTVHQPKSGQCFGNSTNSGILNIQEL